VAGWIAKPISPRLRQRIGSNVRVSAITPALAQHQYFAGKLTVAVSHCPATNRTPDNTTKDIFIASLGLLGDYVAKMWQNRQLSRERRAGLCLKSHWSMTIEIF
jgi:hypothetical protein